MTVETIPYQDLDISEFESFDMDSLELDETLIGFVDRLEPDDKEIFESVLHEGVNARLEVDRELTNVLAEVMEIENNFKDASESIGSAVAPEISAALKRQTETLRNLVDDDYLTSSGEVAGNRLVLVRDVIDHISQKGADKHEVRRRLSRLGLNTNSKSLKSLNNEAHQFEHQLEGEIRDLITGSPVEVHGLRQWVESVRDKNENSEDIITFDEQTILTYLIDDISITEVEEAVRQELPRTLQQVFRPQQNIAELAQKTIETESLRLRWIAMDSSLSGLVVSAMPFDDQETAAMLAELEPFTRQQSSAVTAEELQNTRLYAKNDFYRSIIDGQALFGHFTPIPDRAIKSGYLAGKDVHGETTTNPKFSFGLHFTSLDYVLADSEAVDQDLDYRYYASGGTELQHIPGVFVAKAADLVQAGFRNMKISRNRSNKTQIQPIQDVVITDEGDKAKVEIPIDEFDFIPIQSKIKHENAVLARKARDDTHETRLTNMKKSRGNGSNHDKITAMNSAIYDTRLRELIIERLPAERKEWAESHMYPGMAKYYEVHAQKEPSGQILIPLLPAPTDTGLQQEPLDGDVVAGSMRYAVVKL